MRLETLIQQKYEQMSPSDHLIWQYICRHRRECRQMTLHQLANACQVSHTSVQRFIKLLGMDGFSEFKAFLKWEEQQRPVMDIHNVEKVCYDLNRTIAMAETMDCEELFHRLDEAGAIYAYGSGSIQKYAAYMLKNYLITEEIMVHVIEGREEREMALKRMRAGDVAFLFSVSGNNAQMNEYAKRLRQRGMYLVGICQGGANELSRLCDFSVLFYTQKLEIGRNRIAHYSASGMFSIVEVLALRYAAHQAAMEPE